MSAYTDERLAVGLAFVLRRLKLDLSPRSQSILELHKETLEEALAETDPVEKPAILASIRHVDVLIEKKNS